MPLHFITRLLEIRRSLIGLALIGLGLSAGAANAADCPGNPNALGTSRVLTIDPREYPRIGTVQYSRSLPLDDHEVVLTFDDGPLPPYTNRVLDVLAEHCVKANYFIIGRMARGYPDLIRKLHAAGHVVGNHSENHPLAFERMPLHAVQAEVEQGFASIAAALGDRRAVAPFFRIPGLLRAKEVENYLQSRGLTTWSADVVADDWKHITAAEVTRRAISRIEEKGKGILLLHDIQPATALALPEILRELKARGYRIVQVAPAGRTAPAVPPVAAVVPKEPPPGTEAQARVTAEPPLQARPRPQSPGTVEPFPARTATRTAPAMQLQERAVEPPADRAIATPEPPEAPTPVAVRHAPPPPSPAAADSMARAITVPGPPVRPFTSDAKPARNMPTPGKFLTTEPGGWPPVSSVPVPSAGGVGVSTMVQSNTSADGRFR